MKNTFAKISATILIALLSFTAVRADDTAQNISIAKYISNLKISGDIRVRQENFWRSDSPGNKDRSRQRFRFRLGIQPQIQDVTVHFRLASGTGEQVSTNQTFSGDGSQKSIFIDQAALEWKAFEWVKLVGGKMSNPFWRNYASDLVWDDDLTPEGFAEQFDYQIIERLGVFANFSQIALDEKSGDARDPWLFGYQIGARAKLFEETKWTVALNYIDADYENVANFSQSAVQKGNSRFPGSGVSTVTSNFTMYHVTNELATRVWKWPVSLQMDYVINNGEIVTASQDIMGYQAGAIFNKAKAAMSWEVAYFYKYVEHDATLADLSDSDFGDGGVNRKGHIGWIAFNPRDYVQIKAKLSVTEPLHALLLSASDRANINRAQFDLSVKF